MKRPLLVLSILLATSCAAKQDLPASEGTANAQVTFPLDLADRRLLLTSVLTNTAAADVLRQCPSAQVYVAGLSLTEQQIEFGGKSVPLFETSQEEMQVLLRFTSGVSIRFFGMGDRPCSADVVSSFVTMVCYQSVTLVFDGSQWITRVESESMAL